MDNTVLSFAISFLIGLLIGIEREHSHKEGVQPIGVRTFILFSLLGTLAAKINLPLLTLIISAFVFSIIIFGYLRSTSIRVKKIDIGITTEVAATIVYCLGYLTFFDNVIGVVASALVLLVLLERKRLHEFARKKFSSHEIETTIILVIFALGVIPILPNHTIDPWNLFNPRIFGILMTTIAALQFGGYITIKLFGEVIGITLMGFLGGFISSTAVFANLSHTLHAHPKSSAAITASALFATLSMLIEVMLIVFIASPDFLFSIIKPMLIMCIITIFLALLSLHFNKKNHSRTSLPVSPLNFFSLLRTTLLITSTLILISLAKHFVGTEAVLIIAFLTGLFEIHGISLATALLFLNQHVPLETACLILFTAIFAAFISKFFLLWTLTPKRFALTTSLYLIAIVASGGIAYWLFLLT